VKFACTIRNCKTGEKTAETFALDQYEIESVEQVRAHRGTLEAEALMRGYAQMKADRLAAPGYEAGGIVPATKETMR